MNGNGSGRTITLTWNHDVTIATVGLINGYAKVDPATAVHRYQQERRIVQVTWSIDGHEVAQQSLADADPNPQSVSLPKPVSGKRVVLRIDAVTAPGDPGHNYTAISEIEVTGANG